MDFIPQWLPIHKHQLQKLNLSLSLFVIFTLCHPEAQFILTHIIGGLLFVSLYACICQILHLQLKLYQIVVADQTYQTLLSRYDHFLVKEHVSSVY